MSKPLRPKSDRKIPFPEEEIFHWHTNRRNMLRATLLAGTLSQLSFLQSCASPPKLETGNDLLSSEQVTILKSVMEILYPNDGNGPSCEDLHAFEYIMWVLNDEGAYVKYRDYLVEGIDWANEMAIEHSGYAYVELSQSERERAVKAYIETDYGNEWCSIIITYILEALLLDPVYGANPDGIGWKWLNHTPGFPQPKQDIAYERILETVRAEYPKI